MLQQLQKQNKKLKSSCLPVFATSILLRFWSNRVCSNRSVQWGVIIFRISTIRATTTLFSYEIRKAMIRWRCSWGKWAAATRGHLKKGVTCQELWHYSLRQGEDHMFCYTWQYMKCAVFKWKTISPSSLLSPGDNLVCFSYAIVPYCKCS